MSQDDLIDQAIDAGIHQAEDANPEANVGVPIDDLFASQLTERRAKLKKSASQGSGMTAGLSRNVMIAGVVALVVLVLLFRGK